MTKIALGLVLAVTAMISSSSAFAQSKYDCQRSKGTKNGLITVTKNRWNLINENYAEALDYFINKDYKLCSYTGALSAIGSGINIAVAGKLSKGLIYGLMNLVPSAVCAGIRSVERSYRPLPDYERFQLFTEKLQSLSYEDVMTVCEGLDPNEFSVERFKVEVGKHW